VSTADIEYEKFADPSKTIPTPPVYAARLSALVKNLVNAEGAVAESIRSRRALVEGLEKIIETNKALLATEEAQHSTFSTRKSAIEAKKREVEDGIMRGLSAENSPITPITDPRINGRASSRTPHTGELAEPDRPDVEELTPPPPEPEAVNPAGSPVNNHSASQTVMEQQSSYQDPPPVAQQPMYPANQIGLDLLSSLKSTPVRHFAGGPEGGATKKRKLDDEYAMFGPGEDALADLDEDVAELLKAEGGGR